MATRECASARAAKTTGDQIWTRQAKTYGWDTNATLSSSLKVALIRKYCHSDTRLCDIGCGNGLFARVFARSCAAVTCIDLNSEMLAEGRAMVAREGIGNISFVQASASKLPLADSSFDLVYCFSTLLLIPNIGAALREMVRVLTTSGYLVLDVAGRNNLSALYWRLWYRRRGHFGLCAFSYPSIRRELAELGLEIVEAHALGFCDQWKYIPGLHLLRGIDQFFHATTEPERNLDYRISNSAGFFRLANRWYIVARKAA